MLLEALDDRDGVQARLDCKYGRRCPNSNRSGGTIHSPRLYFLTLPADDAGNEGDGQYTPCPHPRIDARRAQLVRVYTNAADLHDIRKITCVPPSLLPIAHAANAGLNDVSSAEDKVDALLMEVHRTLRDLLPLNKCARLVAHMCKNEQIASEWFACFGAP